MKYYISMTVESEDIQQAWHRIYPAIDKHGEGSPSGISEISITEATE